MKNETHKKIEELAMELNAARIEDWHKGLDREKIDEVAALLEALN